MQGMIFHSFPASSHLVPPATLGALPLFIEEESENSEKARHLLKVVWLVNGRARILTYFLSTSLTQALSTHLSTVLPLQLPTPRSTVRAYL